MIISILFISNHQYEPYLRHLNSRFHGRSMPLLQAHPASVETTTWSSRTPGTPRVDVEVIWTPGKHLVIGSMAMEIVTTLEI